MKKRVVRRRRKQQKEEQPTSAPSYHTGQTRQEERGRGSPFYSAGPVVRLNSAGQGNVSVDSQEELDKESAGPVPAARGSGMPQHEEVHANSVSLQGRTDANYNGGSYHTENEQVRPAEGCDECGNDCIQVTGTLVATYSVTTTVTLPSVDDFSDLSPCQRRRVQDAINNVLAPHEQQHVQAFHQYDGSTRRSFNLTLCRTEFDSRIREMFEAEEIQRRAAAQAASDALDPFQFDVNLDCEEEEAAEPDISSGGEVTAAPPPE